mgnify:CR=1 FL=1
MLTTKRKKQMRAIGHHLKPIVLIGEQAITNGIIKELDRALNDHELVKIKVSGERATRKTILETLCYETRAECIQSMGSSALLFRPAHNPNPRLSNLIRPI